MRIKILSSLHALEPVVDVLPIVPHDGPGLVAVPAVAAYATIHNRDHRHGIVVWVIFTGHILSSCKGKYCGQDNSKAK